MFYRTLELDPRSGQWMADVEGLPVHTWGRTLTKVKRYAHEARNSADTAAPRAAEVGLNRSRGR